MATRHHGLPAAWPSNLRKAGTRAMRDAPKMLRSLQSRFTTHRVQACEYSVIPLTGNVALSMAPRYESVMNSVSRPGPP